MRVAMFCVCLLAMTCGARAEPCPEVVEMEGKSACFDAGLRCRSIESDSARLACFDDVYDGESVDPTVADTDSTVPVELAASPRDFADRRTERVRSNRIEATITGIATNAHGIDFLSLDNGHTWRENEDSRVRFSAGRKVTIEEGMFGSFNLTMEGAPRSVKVKRVE